MVFLKIGEIDTLKEFYQADAFLQTKWREPRLDGKPPEVKRLKSYSLKLKKIESAVKGVLRIFHMIGKSSRFAPTSDLLKKHIITDLTAMLTQAATV